MVSRTITRVRAEYSAMPGLRLTSRQAQRLFDIDREICGAAFRALVTEHFLKIEADGAYTLRRFNQPRERRGGQGDVEGHLATTSAAEFDDSLTFMVGPMKPNALVEGSDVDLSVLLAHVWSGLDHPVVTWPIEPLPTCGTLLIPHLERLDAGQQQRLLTWLDRQASERVQVISVSPSSIFSLVESGDFSSRLFYRLNVVRIAIVARGVVQHPGK